MPLREVVIRDSQGRPVQRSRNLRGILERASSVGIERADVFGPNASDGGTLGVTFLDGSTVLVDFASYKVLLEWVKKKHFKGTVKIAEPISRNPRRRKVKHRKRKTRRVTRVARRHRVARIAAPRRRRARIRRNPDLFPLYIRQNATAPWVLVGAMRTKPWAVAIARRLHKTGLEVRVPDAG